MSSTYSITCCCVFIIVALMPISISNAHNMFKKANSSISYSKHLKFNLKRVKGKVDLLFGVQCFAKTFIK